MSEHKSPMQREVEEKKTVLKCKTWEVNKEINVLCIPLIEGVSQPFNDFNQLLEAKQKDEGVIHLKREDGFGKIFSNR